MPARSSLVVRGHAQADRPLAGGRIQVFDSAGEPLDVGTPTAGINGEFAFPAPASASFRVVVTPVQGDTSPLAAEVRDYDGRWLGINFVTNLVCLLLDAHAKLDVKEAEATIRAGLAIPEGIELGTGLDADRGWFSRKRFAHLAAEHGGVAAHSRSLVAGIDDALHPVVAADEPASSPLGDFAKSVMANLVSDEFASAIGWGVQLIGFGFGGPSMKEISQQLTEIQQELLAISQEIEQEALTQEYQSDQSTLKSDAVDPVTNTSNDLSNQANIASQWPTVGPPVSTAPDAALIAELQDPSNDWKEMANEILDYLLGTNGAPNNMVMLYRAIQMGLLEADSQPDLYAGYPLRSNAILETLQGQANYYLQVVDEALNLLAETSHLVTRDPESGLFTSNVDPIMDAKLSAVEMLARARQAWQQVPVPLASDQVLIDMENGLTWYLAIGSPVTYQSLEFGSTIVTGPYGSSSNDGNQFMLPTESQLQTLRDRLLAINPSDPTLALPTLGFTGLDPNAQSLSVWLYAPYFESAQCGHGGYDHAVYRQELNSGKKFEVDGCGDDHFCYLLCLPFPAHAESEPSNPMLSTGSPGTMSISVDSSKTQLSCTATNSLIQSGGTFTVGTSNRTVEQTTVTRGSDDITQSVSWSSNLPLVADVSNLDGQQGRITWHPGVEGGLVPVIITATFGTSSVTLTVDPPSPAPTADLQGIQVTPTNFLYGWPPQSELYHASGFYSDETAVDLDEMVEWSVVSTNDDQPIPSSQASFTPSQPNMLVINESLGTSLLTIRAEYQGVVGTANIKVPIPTSEA